MILNRLTGGLEMFTTIDEVLSYIEKKTSFDLGLQRLNNFMAELELDYSAIKFIHIAGTNGKGSVSYYTSNILSESGYQTGLFSSPSIEVHNDRIRINNQYITDQFIIDFVNEHYDAIESTKVTMFEIDVAIALAYFVANEVEYAVMETGMGGLYDGTNIVEAIISVITNIGYDHVQYLGDTLEEITANKAGIIKNANEVVLADTNPIVTKIIQERAAQYQAHLHIVDEHEASIISRDPIVYNYAGMRDIKLKSRAHYQIINTMTVIKIIQLLNDKYQTKISEQTMKKVFADCQWPGRFEIVHQEPLVIIDGAHNTAGIKELTNSLAIYDDKKIAILFTALKDKDIKPMVAQMQKITKDITLTTFDFYRADTLANLNKGLDLKTTDNYEAFIKDKLETMHDDEMLLITGSLYFIALIRKLFK